MSRKLNRDQQKRLILKTLSQTDNVSEACQSAKCTRADYNVMVASSYITEAELADCKAAYTDRVLSQMNKLGLDGVERVIVRYNKPVLGSDGKQLYERQPDIAALKWLAERLLSIREEQKQAVVKDTIPAQFKLVIDARDLEKSEFKAIMKIAQAIEDRSNTVNADMPVTSHEKPARLSTMRKGMKSMGTGKRSSTHAMTND